MVSLPPSSWISLPKKGQFYTLALGLFVLMMISVAVLFFKHSISTEEQLVTLSVAQSIDDLDASVVRAFQDVFEQNNDIELSSNTEQFTVKETLPQNFDELEADFLELETHIEADFNTVSIGLNGFPVDFPILFMPWEINYLHQKSPPGTGPNYDEITIESNTNIVAYNISLWFGSSTISGCDGDGGGGDVVIIVAHSSSGFCEMRRSQFTGQPFDITVSGIDVEIQPSGQGNKKLTLFTNGVTMQSNITVEFDPLEEPGYFDTSSTITLDISHPAFGFSKSHGIEIPPQS